MSAAAVTANPATPWYAYAVLLAGVLLMLAIALTAHLKDPIHHDRPESLPAVMLDRERDGDVIGHMNTDLPAALPMTEMTDE